VVGAAVGVSDAVLTGGGDEYTLPVAIKPRLESALAVADYSIESALAQVAADMPKMPVHARAMLVAGQLPKVGSDGMASSGGPPSDRRLERAAERLAANHGAARAVEQLRAATLVPDTSSSGLAVGAALREALRAAETGQHAADLAILLHQENLAETPKGKLTPQGSNVWASIHAVRKSMWAARRRYYTQLVPKGIDVGALVRSVSRGSFTVEMLMVSGTAAKATQDEKETAVQRAWPALVELVAETFPRDGSVRHAFLRMHRLAFDTGRNEDALDSQVAAPFAAMTEAFANYLTGVAPEPTIGDVIDMQVFDSLREYVAGGMSTSPSPKREKAAADAERAAERAAAAERAKAAQAAAKAKAAEAAKASPGGGTGGTGTAPSPAPAPAASGGGGGKR
jgi:hypothetical protein